MISIPTFIKILYFVILVSLLSFASCGQTQEKKEEDLMKHSYTNQLIHESSPYLLQHAHNPVNWYPWGKEALEKAQKENKLIIVSIGYSACHWCHVMEHESFEDEQVAKFMNDNFIAIKVDREERPDIDQIYMNAVQLISGRGGWPLNCIALPDGRPIYGGTYFPKEQWLDMLIQVSDFVKQNPEKTEEQAAMLTKGIQSSEMIFRNMEAAAYEINSLDNIFTNLEKNIDYANGGFNRAPKFPMPVGYQFLLYYHYLTQNEKALIAVTTTLNKMADGGIYDHVGGGFARYSTDAFWKVPHFEKMLYDNAQLVSLYSAAYQLTKKPYYRVIVKETLNFIQRELTSRDGGFYSSLDADSEGEEGKYYVWEKSELQKTLGNKSDLIVDYFSVTERGNWENGQNILFKSTSDGEIADKYQIAKDELDKRVLEAKSLLLSERNHRPRPGLDDKILTSWNSLMLKGYIDAYKAFYDQQYLEIALKNADFIRREIMSSEGRLFRNFKDDKATINGFLDDYSFTIDAFISLYQATFNEKWLYDAQLLTTYTMNHFYDSNSGMFFYSSDLDPELIARKMEISDNVIPSANSQMAKNLFVLGKYFYSNDYIQISKQMLDNVRENALEGGVYYSNWDVLMGWFTKEPIEVAIVGSKYENIQKQLNSYFLPDVLLSGGKSEGTLSLLENKLVEGQTTIYVCQNRVCKLPVTRIDEALKQIYSD